MNLSFTRLQLAAVCALVCATCTALADDLTIAGAPPTSVKSDDLYDFHPQATAVGSLPAHFEIQNAPPWASFEAFDGRLSGAPSAADAGIYPGITISITDGQSRAALPTFSIVVAPPDGTQSTLLSWVPPTENEDGSPLTDLAGYYVYEGPTADALVPIAVTDAAASYYMLSNLPVGTHYFAVTALNASALESLMSPIVSD